MRCWNRIGDTPAETQNLKVLVDFTPAAEPVSVSLVSESSPTTAPEPVADRRTAALRSLCRVEDMQSVSKAGPGARRRWWCKWSGRVSRWKRSCPPAGVSSSLRVPAPVSPLDKTSRHRARAGLGACVRWPGQLWREEFSAILLHPEHLKFLNCMSFLVVSRFDSSPSDRFANGQLMISYLSLSRDCNSSYSVLH